MGDKVNRALSVVVACGGTGGHVFPGLATAQVLQERGHDVTTWLAGKSMEQSVIKGWSGAVVTIPTDNYLRRRWGLGVGSVLRTAFLCWAAMRRQKPNVILAMGGFGSVAPCLTARLLGIPYVLHEANAVPGRAVRFLSRSAAAVAIHFGGVREIIHCRKIVVTGMPIRPEILSAVRKKEEEGVCLLILGGSGGAHAINEIASKAVCKLSGSCLRVIHLTGINDEHFVAKRYADYAVCADVRPFEQNMADIYAKADFVICRAGASTCAEVVALDIPALLIPLPSALDDHQSANAQALEGIARVDVIQQQDCSVEWLEGYLRSKLNDCCSEPIVLDMRKPATNAADNLAGLVEECARSND